MHPDSARVVAWKRENRLAYNAYMRELRKRNPAIEQRNNARKRAARARRREEAQRDQASG
jgi:hypothetical protein